MQSFELTPKRQKELNAIKMKNILQRSAYILGSPLQFAVLAIKTPYKMVNAGVQARKEDKNVLLAVATEAVRPVVETAEDIAGIYRFGSSNLKDAKAKFIVEDKAKVKRQKRQKKAEAEKFAKLVAAKARANGMDKIAAIIPNSTLIEESHGYQEYYDIYFKDCILELGLNKAVIYDKHQKNTVLQELPMNIACYKYLEGFINARKNELQKDGSMKKVDSFVNTLNQKVR